MNTNSKNRILARIVAGELTNEQLDGASGGWGFPPPRPSTPKSSSKNTSTVIRVPNPWPDKGDEDGGADD